MAGQYKKYINIYEHYKPHNNEHTKVWSWFVETKQADRGQLKLNIFLTKPAQTYSTENSDEPLPTAPSSHIWTSVNASCLLLW